MSSHTVKVLVPPPVVPPPGADWAAGIVVWLVQAIMRRRRDHATGSPRVHDGASAPTGRAERLSPKGAA